MSDFSVSGRSQFPEMLLAAMLLTAMITVTTVSIPFLVYLIIFLCLLLAFAICIYEILQNYGIYVEWKRVDD